jgi:hypothetical protein
MAIERCEPRPQPYRDGFDLATRELLKRRKKTHNRMTEVERWNEVYTILFPDSDQDSLPTPCKSTPRASIQM